MLETDDDNSGLEQKSKRSFNWRWMATHILPIFLVLILGAVITIASVPSFRTSFNKFIAKWSPKADVTSSSCPGVTYSSTKYSSPLEYYTASWEGNIWGVTSVSATPSIIKVGETVTIQVEQMNYNTRFGFNLRTNFDATGSSLSATGVDGDGNACTFNAAPDQTADQLKDTTSVSWTGSNCTSRGSVTATVTGKALSYTNAFQEIGYASSQFNSESGVGSVYICPKNVLPKPNIASD